MYANTPSPSLYRVAELRRNEEMSRATKRRRQVLLEPSRPGRLAMLRNLVGHGLIIAGQWIAPSTEGSSDTNRLATS
jgi:hypothetical protein